MFYYLMNKLNHTTLIVLRVVFLMSLGVRYAIMLFVQVGRGISTIIVTDDYLCYKEPKSPYNFFLILIFNKLFKLKLRPNSNIQRRGALLWTVRTSTSCLRSHPDPFAFFTALPRLSDQKISMKCYLILRKLHRTRKIFLKK